MPILVEPRIHVRPKLLQTVQPTQMEPQNLGGVRRVTQKIAYIGGGYRNRAVSSLGEPIVIVETDPAFAK